MRWRFESALGYRWTHTFEVRNERGGPIYHMIFATDNEADHRIMGHLYNRAASEFLKMRSEVIDRRRGFSLPTLFDDLDGPEREWSSCTSTNNRCRLMGLVREQHLIGEVPKMAYIDALRGYAHRGHRRDRFQCVYCGLDGSTWPTWLYLSWDHLLPKTHPLRDDERYIVMACRIPNVDGEVVVQG